ncbi:hypothetical protein [Acinetobacter sp. MD2(2019)]|uniref:hypothetical protein n=1 Tax=Acinetobacter sp. MD2(2019) TaxID=2605273 RepID=UPI002D1F23BC|nr:hypothetical protein [Acinetobacter sp. MD2(2019)]MEB3754657.1 hypothetical protein [Acinetobacter sp. MD2(2019)]
MLEFWFNPALSFASKIWIFIIATALSIGLYLTAPMPIGLILLFAATGLIFVICRFCKLHLTDNDPRKLLYRVFTWIPLALLCALLFLKTINHLLEWGIQGIAIMVMSICLLSPQALFKKSTHV